MYVVISCLAKDITSKNDLFRINALRTIPQVLDPSNLVQLERYLKNVNIREILGYFGEELTNIECCTYSRIVNL